MGMIDGFKDGFINIEENLSVKACLPAVGIVEGLPATTVEVLVDGTKQVCLGMFWRFFKHDIYLLLL